MAGDITPVANEGPLWARALARLHAFPTDEPST
jgi:hypothetical protein